MIYWYILIIIVLIHCTCCGSNNIPIESVFSWPNIIDGLILKRERKLLCRFIINFLFINSTKLNFSSQAAISYNTRIGLPTPITYWKQPTTDDYTKNPIYTLQMYWFNLLKPTCYVMHHQFNIQQLYALPTLYLCVLYLSENKQRLVPLTA